MSAKWQQRHRSFKKSIFKVAASTAMRTNKTPVNLQPMSDLDLMIENGWGDVRQCDLPEDWRTTMGPGRKKCVII